MSEYRVWIDVPGIRAGDVAVWEPLIQELEKRHGDFGPVLGWADDETAQFVLACDAESDADAARLATDAVSQALVARNLGNRYPAGVEVEPVTDAEMEPA